MPLVTRPQIARVLRALLPRRHWTWTDLRDWLEQTQLRNLRAKRSHARRRLLASLELSL